MNLEMYLPLTYLSSHLFAKLNYVAILITYQEFTAIFQNFYAFIALMCRKRPLQRWRRIFTSRWCWDHCQRLMIHQLLPLSPRNPEAHGRWQRSLQVHMCRWLASRKSHPKKRVSIAKRLRSGERLKILSLLVQE